MSKHGFAKMSPDQRRAYGQLGGTIAQALRDEGMAKTHRWDAQEAAAAARKSHAARRRNIAAKARMAYDECWPD